MELRKSDKKKKRRNEEQEKRRRRRRKIKRITFVAIRNSFSGPKRIVTAAAAAYFRMLCVSSLPPVVLFLKLCAELDLGLVGGGIFPDRDLFTSRDVEDVDESRLAGVAGLAGDVGALLSSAGSSVDVPVMVALVTSSIAGAGLMFFYQTKQTANFVVK